MRNMLIVSAIALCAGALWGATSTPEGWLDDYDAALKRAAEEKKVVLADFSGSDWCGWCKKLDREVFATEEFKKGAADKYVLLFIDTPNDKTKLSETAKKRNPELVKKYGIRGFPSVLLMDEKGEVLAHTGYRKGGPVNYLAHIETLVREAPMVNKYIKPIEAVLNAQDANMEKEMNELHTALSKKYPRPSRKASKEEKEEYAKKIQREGAQEMMKVMTKYIPIYEKALAEAKAMEVPPEMEAKKAELISEQESNFNQMKQMVEAIKANPEM